MPKHTRYVTFVVKVSKLCNLRCTYCYEFNELSNSSQMNRESVAAMYEHIARYYAMRDAEEGEKTCVEFNWHGGEPLLVKPQWYWDTFADQQRIFCLDLPVVNTVQTNLTVLDEERIRLLRDGFLGNFGVSLDVFGDLRVDRKGRPRQADTLKNLMRVRELGLRSGGCITVLHGRNVEHVDEIFGFYQQMGLGFRVLPLFTGANDGQHQNHGLSTEQITRALCRFVDLWLTTENPVTIIPIDQWVKEALAFLMGRSPRYYNKRNWVPVWLVNTDGSVFTDGDPYGVAERSSGNIFRQSMDALMSSPGFDMSVMSAERRMAASCMSCEFFGSCTGYPIAESSNNDFNIGPSGERECMVERQTLRHIAHRLREMGVVERYGFSGPQGLIANLNNAKASALARRADIS